MTTAQQKLKMNDGSQALPITTNTRKAWSQLGKCWFLEDVHTQRQIHGVARVFERPRRDLPSRHPVLSRYTNGTHHSHTTLPAVNQRFLAGGFFPLDSACRHVHSLVPQWLRPWVTRVPAAVTKEARADETSSVGALSYDAPLNK